MSNIIVKIDNEDVTSYVYDLTTVPIYARNYDFSQVFTALNFIISYKYKNHGKIKENETIVEVFIDDNCAYTGYVESATISGYYRKKIKVQHIAQKLKNIKALFDSKDITGVYQLRPEFIFESSNVDCYQMLNAILNKLDYDVLVSPDNYIDANGELDEILTNNQVLNNIKYWGQDAEFNEAQQKVLFILDPAKSPSLWDLLFLLQKTFHFSCRFGSLFAENKTVTITTPGHYFAKSFEDLPVQGNVDPSFNGLKNQITIINQDLMADIPELKAVKSESDNIKNNYIDISLYTDPSTSEDPEEIKTEKQYELIKLKDVKIEYPEHFVFVKGSNPSFETLPFVLSTEFIPLQEKFIVKEQPVSIYNRWMKTQDYADIGIYSAGFQKASNRYNSVKYYLYGWDSQILSKMPRKIDYKPKNKIFEITQDEPERRL